MVTPASGRGKVVSVTEDRALVKMDALVISLSVFPIGILTVSGAAPPLTHPFDFVTTIAPSVVCVFSIIHATEV